MDLINVTSTINYVFYLLYEIKPKQVYSNVPVLLSDDFFILLHKGFFWQNYMLEEYFRSSNMRTCAST